MPGNRLRLGILLPYDDPESLNQVSEEIQRLILLAPVPPELEGEIMTGYYRTVARLRQSDPSALPLKVAIRSSAVGEDSEISFAGQYVSSLNVSSDKLIPTYKIIVASLYTPRAISYRLTRGIRDEDSAMSVACLQMVESIASGVVYSRHPFNLLEDNVIVTAVWGLGPYAVDGIITPDMYLVAKDESRSILEKKISDKPVQLVCNAEGGLVEIPVDKEKQSAPCLSEQQIRTLADYAVKLEKHYRCAQDMEWALNKQGELLVLQTRPLHLDGSQNKDLGRTTPRLTQYPLLLEGGTPAFPGVGYGPVFYVRSEEDLLHFPEGAVLVAKHSSPKFVVVMQKAQAIVTDSGSMTGHMASLAREFNIPCVLNLKGATTTLSSGTEITVDAYSGRVYEGKVPELLDLQIPRESLLKDTPVYQTLKRIGDYILPLNLLDPKSSSFVPESCRSLHDIMRLVHEFSYSEMFQLSDLVSDKGGCAIKLEVSVPLDLYIIDLGGGLVEVDERAHKVTVDHVVSLPLKALLRGMLHKDLQWRGPRPVQLRVFFSVMTEQMFFSPTMGGERFGDRSYAIVSDKYLNFSSRVGYHYNILGSYCGQTMNKNYITFSFKGGAADDVQEPACALDCRHFGSSRFFGNSRSGQDGRPISEIRASRYRGKTRYHRAIASVHVPDGHAHEHRSQRDHRGEELFGRELRSEPSLRAAVSRIASTPFPAKSRYPSSGRRCRGIQKGGVSCRSLFQYWKPFLAKRYALSMLSRTSCFKLGLSSIRRRISLLFV